MSIQIRNEAILVLLDTLRRRPGVRGSSRERLAPRRLAYGSDTEEEIGGAFHSEYRVIIRRSVRWLRSDGLCSLGEDERPTTMPGSVVDASQLGRRLVQGGHQTTDKLCVISLSVSELTPFFCDFPISRSRYEDAVILRIASSFSLKRCTLCIQPGNSSTKKTRRGILKSAMRLRQ